MNYSPQSRKNQNFWNFIFSVFFVGVLLAAVWGMYQMRGGYLVSVPTFDAIMMAFATLRVTRLVVYDKITGWFRDLFNYDNGFCATVRDLLSCPWCIGFWAALAIVFFYFTFVWAWTVIFFLALAGAGSLLQITANAIGWKAENLKQDSLRKQ